MDDRARQRALERAAWPGVKARLGHEDASTSPPGATPAERVAMVWRLTLDAWAMARRAMPTYTRAEMPGAVVKRGQAWSSSLS